MTTKRQSTPAQPVFSADVGDLTLNTANQYNQLREIQLLENLVTSSTSTGLIQNYFEAIRSGALPERRIVNKFGHNDAVGNTAYAFVSQGNNYRMPTPSNATKLKASSDDASDTAAGDGARSIILQGLKTDGTEIQNTLATNGEDFTDDTDDEFWRLYRIIAPTSGTYADGAVANSSQKGTITIVDTTGADEWGRLTELVATNGVAQSQIAALTVAQTLLDGKTVVCSFIYPRVFGVDSNQRMNLVYWQRPNAHNESAPYDSMRIIDEYHGLSGLEPFPVESPRGPFLPFTDIFFQAQMVSGTGQVSVYFDMVYWVT